MKRMRNVAGMLGIMFLCSNLLMAEADRQMLVKRWKVVKHQKSGKAVALTENDFMQFANDGIYEHVQNNYYAKGSWALNADLLTINNNGEYNWKIVSVSETTMSLSRGADELIDMEVVKMPASANQALTTNVKYLCMGKWRPNEHHKNDVAIKFLPADFIIFYTDGTYEQTINSSYSKGKWNYNKEETELTIVNTVWKIESLSALFFKISKVTDPKEFMVLAKTR
jgi:hypothetical protein